MKCLTLILIALLLSYDSFAIIGPITGNTSVCVANIDTLSDTTNGGVWSSSNTSVASVSASGIVTGIAAGTVTITYTVGTSNQTKTVIVNPAPSPIFGPSSSPGEFNICLHGSTTLYDTTAGGGSWWGGSPDDVYIFYYGSDNVIVNSDGGYGFVVFTDTAGCSASAEISTMTLPMPPITGDTIIDVDSTTTLNGVGPREVWNSSNTSVAVIDYITGVVSGISPGTTTISYTYGCIVTTTLKVIIPSEIPVISTEKGSNFTLYPNPTSSQLTISSTNQPITQITLTNLLGQTLYTNTCNTDKAQIDIADLPAGVYIIKINGSDVRKFVKE